MSGHSKWSTIKHKKAAKDAKKGKYSFPYDFQHFLFPLLAPLLFPVYFQTMNFRFVLTRKRYAELGVMLPHYISHFVITYAVFQSVSATIAFFLAVKLTDSAWFAARPSGTEDKYKIYAESLKGADHLTEVQSAAKSLVDAALR